MPSTKLIVGYLPLSIASTATANGPRTSCTTSIRSQSSLSTLAGDDLSDLIARASIAWRLLSRLLIPSMVTSVHHLGIFYRGAGAANELCAFLQRRGLEKIRAPVNGNQYCDTQRAVRRQ